MANFSQLRRRQSSRECLYRHQLSHLLEEVEVEQGDVPGVRPRATRPTLVRQLSEGLSSVQHASPDEMGELMWEMRPRYATSAGELKRKRKKSLLEKRRDTEVRAAARIEKETSLAALKPGEEGEGPPSRVSTVSQFVEPTEEGAEVRESWDSKLTFILATIGYAVGLGNVWRFPYLAQKNGGGAFLIPYCIMLFAEGLPLFLLELAIGQRLRKGSIGVWKQVSPYLAGIGIASGVVSFNVALYYNTIIAWCLNYFIRSFQYPLPWSYCPEELLSNETVSDNASAISAATECEASSPTQYFWYRETLDISGNIEDPDNFNWPICLCLLAAWTLVYLCIIKGITENPKIIYITAIYPYVVLVIFFFRGITLEGMTDGIVHLFKPKWSRLADPVVWLEAGTQIFFSLGLAFGGLIAYSSYNPVNNNCTRDAIIVAFTNCGTSLFAGVVIFAIMGFKANVVHRECLSQRNATLFELFNDGDDSKVSPDGVVQWTDPRGDVVEKRVPVCNLEKELDNSASGTGLAFILFTEAVNQFPAGNVWAILFFLMLFTLGLDSQFGTMQGVIQCIIDLKLCPNVRKEILTGVACSGCLVLSLMFAHGAGNYIFTLFDNFAGSVPLLVIALFECIAVAYVYGLKRFSDDLELMTGKRPSLYWLICWKFISPMAMSLILLASIVDVLVSGAGYEAWDASQGLKVHKEWPLWAQMVILVLIGLSVLWIPLVALLQYFGVTLLAPEAAGWFPADELRAHYSLKEHTTTRIERTLFGIRPDGSEGILCPTKPSANVLQTTAKIEIGSDSPED